MPLGFGQHTCPPTTGLLVGVVVVVIDAVSHNVRIERMRRRMPLL